MLDSLPADDRRSGMAEAVKVALIRDRDFFLWIEAHAARLAARLDPMLASWAVIVVPMFSPRTRQMAPGRSMSPAAASAMVIVTTLALASMSLNHLVLPASYPDINLNLYRWLLWGRRLLIGLIIAAGYGFYTLLQHKQGLVELGLISFVAVAQFLPGITGLLYWRRATRAGFIAGLLGGGAGSIWSVALATLVLGLLFAPLRRWIQRFIDRRLEIRRSFWFFCTECGR